MKLKVTTLEDILGQEWEISPAGGATGEAFFAKNKEQQLFLKRNSSPFLAVLSAEGIVPKLVWTRRLESGDVITAQRWISGRELNHKEMKEEKVARLLRKIHQSKPLLTMLTRLGKAPLKPEQLLEDVKLSIDEELASKEIIRSAFTLLNETLPAVVCDEAVVCHCDINHNNWLLTDDEQLFLIDWDGAMIADPAIDLGMLLHSYVPKDEWSSWLETYGVHLTDNLIQRMNWYVIIQIILSIQWNKTRNRLNDMDAWITDLRSMVTNP